MICQSRQGTWEGKNNNNTKPYRTIPHQTTPNHIKLLQTKQKPGVQVYTVQVYSSQEVEDIYHTILILHIHSELPE